MEIANSPILTITIYAHDFVNRITHIAQAIITIAKDIFLELPAGPKREMVRLSSRGRMEGDTGKLKERLWKLL